MSKDQINRFGGRIYLGVNSSIFTEFPRGVFIFYQWHLTDVVMYSSLHDIIFPICKRLCGSLTQDANKQTLKCRVDKQPSSSLSPPQVDSSEHIRSNTFLMFNHRGSSTSWVYKVRPSTLFTINRRYHPFTIINTGSGNRSHK